MHIIPYILIGFPLGAVLAHGIISLLDQRRNLLTGIFYIASGVSGFAGIIWLIVWKP